MARAKTASFTLTETVTLATAQSGTGSLDIGSYLNVASRQGLAIESIDFIFQNSDFEPFTSSTMTTIQMQVSDLLNSTSVKANDRSLIASGSLVLDTDSGLYSQAGDIFPDNYGVLAEARMVVNDTIYFRVDTNTNVAASITALLRCKIVTLDAKDFMAIAIQSTASDN